MNEELMNTNETEDEEYFDGQDLLDKLDEIIGELTPEENAAESAIDISELDAETKEKLGVEDEETEEAEPEDESE